MKKITSKKLIKEASQKEETNQLDVILFDKKNCLQFFEENTFFEKTENGKTIILRSKKEKNTAQTNRLICIDFEKLLDRIDSNLSQKCDYVFINYYNQHYYFVELKGDAERISKPYKQIKVTIELFKQRLNISRNSIFGIIVGGSNETGRSNKTGKVNIPIIIDKRNEFIKTIGRDLFHAQNTATMSSPLSSKDDFLGS
ncbi:hypothetical protein Fleli_3323 [Bernardetia litoralis DSM 6794]|uniref:Uncharacterized protein n=1 Tax=Bernardetia litoralis (strain ATCC 23117 / DSM 6794 / NBRC 15988 / NCIMB 1366 / Fx l1 / Sio-4) TaxID=880071 RepID=I4ANW7_BERLS|nr:hypothetical protein [Bernardetia litoralis]AFM05652.1 hypothetical protein Fleli_3323 [Bernardetia litoralis DSM 6794]